MVATVKELLNLAASENTRPGIHEWHEILTSESRLSDDVFNGIMLLYYVDSIFHASSEPGEEIDLRWLDPKQTREISFWSGPSLPLDWAEGTRLFSIGVIGKGEFAERSFMLVTYKDDDFHDLSVEQLFSVTPSGFRLEQSAGCQTTRHHKVDWRCPVKRSTIRKTYDNREI